MKNLQTLRRVSWLLALAIPAAVACSSKEDGSGGSSVPASMEPGGHGSPNPNLDISSDPSLDEPLPPASAGPLVLRRLSPREYTNTLHDLLGDVGDPGAALPDEANRQTGFTVYESASLVSAEVFLKGAEKLLADKVIKVPACAGGADQKGCASKFISDFGRRAFRRPVRADESTNLLALYDTARGLGFNYADAVGNVAVAMLQSSGFLYLWEVGDQAPVVENGLAALTPHQIASRLSYLLWGTMPDAELAAAADAGKLDTADRVAEQAARLLKDSDRLSGTMSDFHLQWLRLDNLDDLQKDRTMYPGFDDEVRAGLKEELLGFVSDVLIQGDGTSRSLLTANQTVYTNDSLAKLYGATSKPDSMDHIALNPEERSGLFTMAAFLASTGNAVSSSPPRRGKIVWEDLLCGKVPPPPANVPPVGPPTESSTTRQRFESHTGNPCATTCHTILDPPGFAFENYDAIGSYRTTENGFPVDASGTLVTPAGGVVEFENAVELMGKLSTSYEVDRCVANGWFRFMMNRDLTDGDKAAFEESYRASGAGIASDFSVRDFVAQVVSSSAFRMRAVEP
jgi:Protein of unknown function (DUF1592)/Protein of unknown function (DUF1588)/Protein of unknown function (DUF1595)/Protein of unknown function (DUF1587)/Protein of unknown function (DUF1585)